MMHKFLFLKIVLILANSADPDEMPLHAAFHQGQHCLPKDLLIRINHVKGLIRLHYNAIRYII